MGLGPVQTGAFEYTKIKSIIGSLKKMISLINLTLESDILNKTSKILQAAQ